MSQISPTGYDFANFTDYSRCDPRFCCNSPAPREIAVAARVARAFVSCYMALTAGGRNPPGTGGGLVEEAGCNAPDEPGEPFPVLLSGSSSLIASAEVVEETDDPPEEGGVFGSRGGDVFRLSCCR
uniref:Uncharacterized protein n=1 Tax=Anopheles farauti TaxID=69004 RepID=A0A182PZX6_9DIPT